MKKYTAEDLMKKFGIKDFRKLSKKQFVEIVSKLDSLDPEVAKQLIDKIPDFYKLLGAFTQELSLTVQKELETADKTISDGLNGILASINFFQDQLKEPSLSENERIAITSQIGKLWEMHNELIRKIRTFGFLRLSEPLINPNLFSYLA